MLYPMVTATLQNMRKPYNVAINIRKRVFYGIAYASLGSSVNYELGLISSKSSIYCMSVSQIDAQGSVIGMIGMPG